MKTTIIKRFTFEAAHDLPNHDGKCRGLHGHSYVVEVGITGHVNDRIGEPDQGMILDFDVVKQIFNENIHSRCDHAYLNEALPFLPNTTAENLAMWIGGEMQAGLNRRNLSAAPRFAVVSVVRVWETATGCAEVTWA